MSSFVKIPENLHQSYIDHALAGGVSGYKYWSFKNSATQIKKNLLFDTGGSSPSTFSSAITGAMGDVVSTMTGFDALGDAAEETLNTAVNKLNDLFDSADKAANDLQCTYYPFSDTFVEFITKSSALDKSNSTMEGFCSNIPIVTVRAFVPDTILGLFYTIFSDIAKGISIGFEAASGEGFDSIKQAVASAAGVAATKIDYFIKGMETKSGYENFIKDLASGIGLPNKLGNDTDIQVLDLPYIMYYKLMGAKTNNIYEFPAIVDNIFSSNSYGWSTGSQFNLGSTENGIFSLLANTIGTTITPIFDPRHNGSNEPAGFTLTLDLVNDTLDHAVANYNLVQSLILYNMWVQYGITQGPGSLYDVKIAGGQRFLMCTGNFSVKNKGVIRKVHPKTKDKWKPWKEETRIPDVYSLSLEFKSLLPNNLNNYMISICVGNTMNSPGMKEESVAEKLIDNTKTAIENVCAAGEAEAAKASILANKDSLLSAIKNSADIGSLQSGAVTDLAKDAVSVAVDGGNVPVFQAEINDKIAEKTLNSVMENPGEFGHMGEDGVYQLDMSKVATATDKMDRMKIAEEIANGSTAVAG